jgi:hypothetical protein
MIDQKFMDPVAIKQGSVWPGTDDPIGVERRIVICCFQKSGQATGCGLSPTSGCRVPALFVGLKNVSMNDCSKSPLNEKVVAAIPLVPLFTIFL